MESSSKKKEKGQPKDKSKAQPLLQANNPTIKSKSLPTTNLFSTLNCNSNIFSQLSSIYSQQQQPEDNKSSSSDFSSLFQTKFDSEIQRILHALSKRSEVTKTKALLELQEILKTRNESFLEAFLPTWTYLYKQIMTCEYDKKLLEEANHILLIYVNQAKTCLKSQFKELFPYWFLSMNDPNNEVNAGAQKSFDLLFPIEKRAQVIMICADGILKNMGFFLKLDITQILDENNALNESQAFEILDRLTVAMAHSLAESLKWMKGSPKEAEYIQMLCKTLDIDKESVGLIKMLEILENKKRGLRSRAAILDLIAEIYINMDPEKDFPNQSFHITKAVFSLIDDKERIIQQALWKSTLVSLLKKTPEAIWKKICEGKLKEILINRIYECLRRAGQGIGAVFYENLTIFLSLLPFAKLKGETNEEAFKWKLGFIKSFLEGIWNGMIHEEIKFFSESLVSCYFECLYFLNLKRFAEIKNLGLSESLLKYALKTLKGFMKNPVIDYLKNYNSSQALNAYKSIPNRIGEFLENVSNSIMCSEDYYEIALKDYFNEIKEGQLNIKSPSFYENYCKLLRELLGILKNQNHKILNILIETLVNDSYRESFFNIQKDFFEGKLEDASLDQVNGNLKGYNMIVAEIRTSINDFSKQFISELKIIEIFGTFSQILDKIMQNLLNINKISNIEKLSLYYSRILRSWIEISSSLQMWNEADFLKVFNSIPEQILVSMKDFQSFSLLKNQNFLIVVTMILDPLTSETLFTDFQILAQNPQQQDALIWKILEFCNQGQKKKEESSIIIKKSAIYQDLLIEYIDLFLNLQGYGMGIIQIPCLLRLLRESLNENQMVKALEKTMDICEEALNKKNFNKLKVVYLLWTFYLTGKHINKDEKEMIIDKMFSLFFKAIIKAYSLKKNKDILDYFYELLALLEKNTESFKKVMNLAFDEFFALIQESLKFSEDDVEKTIEALCDLLDFLKNHHRNNEILAFFKKNILNVSCFKDALASKTIWIILKACLEIINDYQSIEEILKFSNWYTEEIWLSSLLLSAPNTYAIFKDLSLKKYYQELVRPELLNLLIGLLENNENFKKVIPIFEQLILDSEEKSLIFLNGLRILLISFKESQSSFKENELIMNVFSKYIAKSLDLDDITLENTEILLRRSLISKTILLQINGSSCLTQDLIAQTLKKLNQIITNNIQLPIDNELEDLKFLIYLDFLQTIQPFINNDNFLDEGLVNDIILFIFKSFKVENLKNFKRISINFIYGTLFEYMNLVTEKKTFVVLSDNIPAIEALIRESINFNINPQKFYIKSLIFCNAFLRKILGFIEAFSNDFRMFIQKELLSFFVKKLRSLTEGINEELMIDESNDQMIIEFAETISRFAAFLLKEVDERVLYELLVLPFPAIQKSAFSLLKLSYQTIKPIVNIIFDEEGDSSKEINQLYPDILIDVLYKYSSMIQKSQDEQLINPITYSYLLTWVSMILKISNILAVPADLDLMKRLMKDFLEKKPELYHDFLNSCFKGLKNLDPNLSGLGNIGGKGNNMALEMIKLDLEWSEFLSRDLNALYSSCISSLEAS